MAKWKLGLLVIGVIAMLGGAMAATTGAQTAFACDNDSYKADANGHCVKVGGGATKKTNEKCSKPRFFGLEPWYEYLPMTTKTDEDGNTFCEIKNFTLLGAHSSILLIALAIVDDLLRIAGMVAIIFIIVGGFRYITSQGNPEDSNKARSTILNALIGLVIAVLAITIVSFLGNKFGT